MQQRNTTTQTRWSPWDFRDTSWLSTSCVGYSIECLDGSFGKVDEVTQDVGSSYLIVDTGPLIFGKKALLPAGVVSRIDHDSQQVFVDRTKDQIKDAPEFDEHRLSEMTYRDEFGRYYSEGGRGWHDPGSAF